MKITFNMKAYWISPAYRCYAGRIVGIYPENNTCLFIIDGETEEERLEISKLFPTKNDAVLSALKPIEENIRTNHPLVENTTLSPGSICDATSGQARPYFNS